MTSEVLSSLIFMIWGSHLSPASLLHPSAEAQVQLNVLIIQKFSRSLLLPPSPPSLLSLCLTGLEKKKKRFKNIFSFQPNLTADWLL